MSGQLNDPKQVAVLPAVSNGVLNNLISKHGEVAVAAVGIARKRDILPANIAVGITQGSLPLLAVLKYLFIVFEERRRKHCIFCVFPMSY